MPYVTRRHQENKLSSLLITDSKFHLFYLPRNLLCSSWAVKRLVHTHLHPLQRLFPLRTSIHAICQTVNDQLNANQSKHCSTLSNSMSVPVELVRSFQTQRQCLSNLFDSVKLNVSACLACSILSNSKSVPV